MTAKKRAFILGMVTAFSECVAAGCKPIALSPPLTDADYAAVAEEAAAVIAAHGLMVYHEENLDLPPEARAHWLVLYAKPAAIDVYLALRQAGHSPMRNLDAFAQVLGYAPDRIHTGYDAYHAYFPME